MITSETIKAQNRANYHKHRDAYKKQMKEYRDRLKAEVFDAYGGRICACCSEQEYGFLTIDHVNDDGAQHRAEIGYRGGIGIYLWLRKNGFPSGFQVLCYNCNLGRARNKGICPHQERLCPTKAA